MKKKILCLVFISILALLPIKVNAEEVCEVYKNYYFLHDAIQQWNQAIQEACADENGVYDEDTINNSYILKTLASEYNVSLLYL